MGHPNSSYLAKLVPPAAPYTVNLAYAPNGNVLTGNDSVNGNWVYTYDALNRLSTANKNSGQLSYAYTFDRFGNRLAVNGVGPAYDVNNRIASGYGYTYDLSGNVLNDGVHSYAYDAENRIIKVDGGATATYAYDASGRRVQSVTVGATKDFLYDLGGQAVTELTQSGSTLNWSRAEVFAAGHHLATYTPSTTIFDHSDWLGTERARTTLAGAMSETCTSNPYGDALACAGTDTSPLHFTGKEHDSESGLDNFEARYLGSSLGRFMSPDSAGLLAQKPAYPQSWNLFVYAMNNPLIFIDPTGLDCVYANDAGNGVESIDHNSNSGECGQNGGSWAPGYADENWAHFNRSTGMFQVGSFNGSGNNATVDYTMFEAGAQTQFNGDESSCLSGCAGFSLANANWLQSQLVGNSRFDGLDGYIQFLAGREKPLGGGLLVKLAAGPLNPSTDHWAGPGGMGPPGGRGDWAASVHDYNFFTNGITMGSYFNPTLSVATSKALIQSNNKLIRNAGAIQSIKMGLFFGVANAVQWYSNSWK